MQVLKSRLKRTISDPIRTAERVAALQIFGLFGWAVKDQRKPLDP